MNIRKFSFELFECLQWCGKAIVRESFPTLFFCFLVKELLRLEVGYCGGFSLVNSSSGDD